jgi:hypothetical protein
MARRSPHHLKCAFTGNRLTHFGGLFLLQLFFKKLRLRKLIERQIRFGQRNNRYSIPELLLSLIYPTILGLGRIETAHILSHNGVFQYLTGLPACPNPTSLRRFLLRMAWLALAKLRKLQDRLLQAMLGQRPARRRFVFDLDSTVLVLYGQQQGAHIGYNPKKPGRPSYHPLLCFDGQTKDFWHGELRPGDTYTSSGAVALLQACFAKLPARVRLVVIRADKGFYDHKIVEWLSERKARFVIVAKLTVPIKSKLGGLRYTSHWRTRVATAEFFYQPWNWSHPHRFVVIRRPKPEAPSDQLALFPIGRYVYQVFVTNLDLKPMNVWRFYNQRAAVELIVKELKGDYPLAKIPTKHFKANETYFHVLLLAYNLVNWFKRLCLPSEFHAATLQTLRTQLLLVPAELVCAGHRPLLKLPANFFHQRAWNQAIRQIARLTF